MFDKLLFYFTTLQSACYLLQFMFQTYPLLFVASSWFCPHHASKFHQVGYGLTAPLQSHRCAVQTQCRCHVSTGWPSTSAKSKLNKGELLPANLLEPAGDCRKKENAHLNLWLWQQQKYHVGIAVTNWWLGCVCFLKQVCGATVKCYTQSIAITLKNLLMQLPLYVMAQ